MQEGISIMKTVFVDGSAGTTGLRIASRLSGRSDIQFITLPEEKRKDPQARREALNAADIAFLCLPDDAAREAAAIVDNPKTVLIDTSTAHRVHPDWVYGMPELPGQRERIASTKRIANPGCHASGYILLVAPLVAAGILGADSALSCISLTGYSGGGKKMIADYEADARDPLLDAPRQYGLSQHHKHVPEMVKYSGLSASPVFSPIVAPYYAGMQVIVPLTAAQTTASVEDILAVYRQAYPGPVVRTDAADEAGFLSAGAMAGRDDALVGVWGEPGHLTLVARYDNLGKGASGAAIQNMNTAMDVDECEGLVIG